MTAPALEGAVRRHLDHLAVERGLAENTLAAYRRDLARYAAWLAASGVGAPEEVDAGHVTGFVAALGTGGATSAAPERLPRALSVDAVTRLLEAVPVDSPAGLRDRALLEFLYGTGARVSEAVGLDVDDVVGVTGEHVDDVPVVRLFGKGSKERIVPVGSYAAEALAAWLVRGRPALVAGARPARGTPALFLNLRGGRLSRQSAWSVITAAADRAGLAEEVSPHTLRHSFATHLMQGGADVRVVQELLGHASVTTTQVYTRVTAEALREVFAQAHPRARWADR